jgi:pilus assembly protein CpaB
VERKAILIALVLSALGGGCLFMYMKRYEAEVSGGPKVQVLIATRDLRLGEKLDKSALGARPLPQAYLEQRHIRLDDIDTVLGAQVSMTVHAGEAVLWSDLSSMQSERRDLSSLIEPGMRALTIVSRGASPFSGLLRPGDRVDLLYTSGTSMDPAGGPTITLLQNLLVLAIGSDVGTGDKCGGNARAVTVSVTPQQSQLVTHARAIGVLDVVLRNPEDIVVLKDLPETHRNDIAEAERRQRFTDRLPFAARPKTEPQGAAREIDQIK